MVRQKAGETRGDFRKREAEAKAAIDARFYTKVVTTNDGYTVKLFTPKVLVGVLRTNYYGDVLHYDQDSRQFERAAVKDLAEAKLAEWRKLYNEFGDDPTTTDAIKADVIRINAARERADRLRGLVGSLGREESDLTALQTRIHQAGIPLREYPVKMKLWLLLARAMARQAWVDHLLALKGDEGIFAETILAQRVEIAETLVAYEMAYSGELEEPAFAALFITKP